MSFFPIVAITRESNFQPIAQVQPILQVQIGRQSEQIHHSVDFAGVEFSEHAPYLVDKGGDVSVHAYTAKDDCVRNDGQHFNDCSWLNQAESPRFQSGQSRKSFAISVAKRQRQEKNA